MEQNANNNLPYNQLLAIATAAKGDKPLDASVPPMPKEDQEWLQKVLQECASDADPVKKLKAILKQLDELAPATNSAASSSTVVAAAQQRPPLSAQDVDRLQALVHEELIDLVCDLDLAADFCQLGGLQIVRRFLADAPPPKVDAIFLGLVAELAQYNQKVQEHIIKQEFLLPHAIQILRQATPGTSSCPATTTGTSAGGPAATVAESSRAGTENATAKDDENIRSFKAIGAISAIVKGYIPAAGKFLRLDGPQIFTAFFAHSLQNGDEKIVHRCAVAAKSMSSSFAEKISEVMKLSEVLEFVTKKLTETDANKYRESLEFIQN